MAGFSHPLSASVLFNKSINSLNPHPYLRDLLPENVCFRTSVPRIASCFRAHQWKRGQVCRIMRAVSLSPNQYTIQATYGDGKGGYRTSREDLNLCIGNRMGNLVAQEK
jgi:hypothetical protein